MGFQTPGFPSMILKQWRPLLSAKRAENQSKDLYTLLIEEAILNRIRAAICNMWIVQQPTPAVQLFKSVKEIMPEHLYNGLLTQLVVPKLREAIIAWMPSDGSLIHQWILPWQEMLGEERMIPFYPLIRRQIGRALVRWNVSDPFGIKLVRPWADILSLKEMNELYIKTVCPKLELTLTTVFGASLDGSSSDPFDDVMKWEQVVPNQNFVTIMVRGFFPSWLSELHKWISRPDSDLENIATWYSGWKKSFSPRMLEHPLVLEHLNTALDMMNCILQDKELPEMEVIRSVNPALTERRWQPT